MQIEPIRTGIILPGDLMEGIINRFVTGMPDRSILAVTSKIVSLTENRIAPAGRREDKINLAKREADYYIDTPSSRRFGLVLTVKSNILIPNAGIDESNGNGSYILWPDDPFKSARNIWAVLRSKFPQSRTGVIITDSRVLPLRWGTTGFGLSWCGFIPLKNYIGAPDLFGQVLRVTKASMLDGLAAAAVTVMGEGNERTPLALISDIPGVSFNDLPPTAGEIKELTISPAQDLYAPLIDTPIWRKRRERRKP
ncbi:hypothetical protein A2Z33_05135 [Candidatus Gottesmanbacteria bacterium RBG_16_52_11]|uniref:Coenzyme F420:L-glutamate ligase-like domain-containing protein n=1 Tax=Candidatus Gottesmanbacteria bacterium RBG_16_52_11 TaxID=1798374 RepID=A0A1F5YQL0_9BACT|nr:MAG: hypothetical protein A2Z33_05135 [Candidatus Gottesmanbacteria bacterium RBG_16_52_11]